MENDRDAAKRITRREAIAAGLVVASAVAAAGASKHGAPADLDDAKHDELAHAAAARMPVVFIPHGGGPWPFVDLGMVAPAERNDLATYLESVRTLPKTEPKALLVISAHWEERVPTLMTALKPTIFYDYYGFPPESYQITWPAPGSPDLVARVRELLHGAAFETATDDKRGFDHGTFIPLKLTYPEANVPTVQLSLVRGLNPQQHLALGRALAPLRDEGVLIVGSGMSFHNLRNFGPSGHEVSETFDAWLRETVPLKHAERDRRLAEWERAPSARAAHPREEHLLPLMVIAGAAGADQAKLAWNGTFGGVRLSAYHFG
jgi:aromatic ring-opening dioxygenase catalytic subunit (LigB family)